MDSLNADATADPAADAAEARERALPKMSFLDHLEELRKRLIISMAAVFIAFLACWHYAAPIYAKLQEPLTKVLAPGDKLPFTRLTGPFFLYMKVAAFAGLFLAAPVILFQLWLFTAPGLYRHERRWAAPFIIATSTLFVLGGFFGWRVMLPGTCKFLLESGRDFKPAITITNYLSVSRMLCFGTGLGFQIPSRIVFMSRL